MAVTVTRVLTSDPIELCQGCGIVNATDRIETMPDVDDVPPADLFLCSACFAGLKGQLCVGTVTPGQPGGKVGRHHPDQSKRAAATVDAGTQQAHLLTIVDWWTSTGDVVGRTCAEAAPELSERVGHTVSRNQTATRMGELRDKCLVSELCDDGVKVKRQTEGDNEGQVWVVTRAGHAEAMRLTR